MKRKGMKDFASCRAKYFRNLQFSCSFSIVSSVSLKLSLFFAGRTGFFLLAKDLISVLCFLVLFVHLPSKNGAKFLITPNLTISKSLKNKFQHSKSSFSVISGPATCATSWIE